MQDMFFSGLMKREPDIRVFLQVQLPAAVGLRRSEQADDHRGLQDQRDGDLGTVLVQLTAWIDCQSYKINPEKPHYVFFLSLSHLSSFSNLLISNF